MSIAFLIILLALLFRVLTSIISKNNASKLLSLGAEERGLTVSKLFILLWYVIYIYYAVVAWDVKDFSDNIYSVAGLIALLVIYAILIYIIVVMGKYYTIKLFKTPNQELIVNNLLFKYIKHPIYILVLIPEVIAVGAIANSIYGTAAFTALTFILILLRLVEENKVLKEIKAGQ